MPLLAVQRFVTPCAPCHRWSRSALLETAASPATHKQMLSVLDASAKVGVPSERDVGQRAHCASTQLLMLTAVAAWKLLEN